MKIERRKRNDLMSGIISDSNRYITDKSEISLVGPCMATMQTFEIYCIEGHLFDSIERYETKEEAEKRIVELLL